MTKRRTIYKIMGGMLAGMFMLIAGDIHGFSEERIETVTEEVEELQPEAAEEGEVILSEGNGDLLLEDDVEILSSGNEDSFSEPVGELLFEESEGWDETWETLSLLEEENEEEMTVGEEPEEETETLLEAVAEGQEKLEWPTSGTLGSDITWTVDESGHMEISGTGPIEDVDGTHWNTTNIWSEYNYSSIKSIRISEGITSIGFKAFSYFGGLTQVQLPDSLTEIGSNAFSGCANLKDINLPDGLKEIGERAFYACDSLTGIKIPASVDTLAYAVFERCRSMKTAGPIGSGCDLEYGWTETIPANAFWGDNWLTSIYIPASVTKIHGNPIEDCSKLEEIKVASDNRVYDSRNGCNAIIETATGALVAACDKTVIPEGVKIIGPRAFINTHFTEITFPSSVREVQEAAFSGCDRLNKVTFPEGLSLIAKDAFLDCTSICEITLPMTVQYVGENAFSWHRYDKLIVRVHEGNTVMDQVRAIEGTTIQIIPHTYRGKGTARIDVAKGYRIQETACSICGKTGQAQSTPVQIDRLTENVTLDLAAGSTYYLYAYSEAQLAGLFTIFDANADKAEIQLISGRVIAVKMNKAFKINLVKLGDQMKLGQAAAGSTVYFYVGDAKMTFERLDMQGTVSMTSQNGLWRGTYTSGRQIQSVKAATTKVQVKKYWVNVIAAQIAKKLGSIKKAGMTVNYKATTASSATVVKKTSVTLKKKLATKSLTLTCGASQTITKGSSFHFFATASPVATTDKLTVSSSNRSVASVSYSGRRVTVIGKSGGKAVITVRSGSKSKRVTVIVNDPKQTKTISLSQTSVKIKKKTSVTVAVNRNPSGTTSPIKASSSKSSVASVRVSGGTVIISGKKKGKAKITVKCGLGSAAIRVTVSK